MNSSSQLYTKFYNAINKDKKLAPRGFAIELAKEEGISLDKFYRLIRSETQRRTILLQAKRVCKYQVDKDNIDKLI